MKPQEMMQVITAFEQGQPIEFKGKVGASRWIPCTDPSFNFGVADYRVKPAVKKIKKSQWVYQTPAGKIKITPEFFAEFKDARLSNALLIGKAHWTEILVEV